MRLALALALARAAPGGARADDASEARFFDGLARRAFEHGDYRGALEHFLLAYTAAASPAIAFNVAVCADLVDEPRMAFTYFQRFLEDADAPAERRERAVAALARLRPRLRVVTVRSEPPGAAVFLDTVERGVFGRTPIDVALEPGEGHALLVRADGHHDAREPVGADVPSGAEVMVRLAPRTGIVRVDVAPEDAHVAFLRGDDPVAEAHGDGALELPIGRYRLRVLAEGHAESERLVVVTEGVEQAIALELAPIAERTALLLLAAGGTSGIVRLDDRPVGRTPLRLPGVRPGRHRVEVEADDGRVWRGEVELAAGEARLVRAR